MAVVANVAINIEGKNAQAVLDALQKKVTSLNGSFDKVKAGGTGAGSGIASALSGIVAPAAAVATAVAALKQGFDLLATKQADIANLENGLKDLVGNSQEAAKVLVGIADELGKKTLFNEEDFTQGFKLLTSFKSIATDSYERVATAAADVAQVTNQDVNQSLLQLAKALEDPEKGLTALARSGTQFTEQQKQQVKALVASGDKLGAQNFILKELERQYGGAAVAAGSAGLAGVLDTLGEVTRDFLRAVAAVLATPLQSFLEFVGQGVAKVAEGWEWFNSVLTTKILPILQPLIDKVKEVLGSFDPVTIADLWQGVLVIAVNAVAKALELIVPVAIKIIELFEWIGNNPVFQALLIPLQAVAAKLLESRGEITKFTEASKGSKKALAGVSTAVNQLPDPIERAKQSAQGLVEQFTAARDRVQNTIAHLQNMNNIGNARVEALQAQNTLEAKILDYQYQQAQTAQQRLNIATQQYQNELRAADIAYQKSIAQVQLDQQLAQLKIQDLEIEYKRIEAAGMLAALKETEVDKQEAIRQKTTEALQSQGEAIKIATEQASAQEAIAGYQVETADAVRQAAEVQAKMNFETKATSDAIGLSAQAAGQLANSISSGSGSASQLSSNTQQVASSAGSAAGEYARLASQAEAAAAAIARAVAQQEALNAARARSGGGGGGGGGSVSAAKEGAYWKGGFTAFAKGGVVTGPTLGLIGEGGEPEYIIPESKAAGFATNYLSGVRGSSAVPKFAEGGYVAPSASVSIQTGPVTNMNGTNYVTTQDLSRAVQAGVNQTLSLIAGDGSVRRQLGLA